jgi:cell division FtsZ-interacting protein ZapD
MTQEEEKLLSGFDMKLKHLIYMYDDLKRQNVELQELLNKEKQDKEQLSAQYNQLKSDYADLKSAAALGQNGGSARETKLRIDKLVREIDQCIAQLE